MSENCLFPFDIYKHLYQEKEVFFNTWAALLPIQPRIVTSPKLLKVLTAADDLPPHFVSHDLLVLYRCFLYFVPQLLLQQQFNSETVALFKEREFSVQNTFKTINDLMQKEQIEIYDRKTDANVLDFIKIYELAIFKCVYLLSLSKTTNSEETIHLLNCMDAVLQMNSRTLEKLGFQDLMTKTVLKDNAEHEYDTNINAWQDLIDKVSLENETF